MNSHLLIPKIGLRFLLTGTSFEVSWTSQGMVRYSAITGGKIYSISIEKFTEKYHSGEIKLNGDLSDSVLSKEKTRDLLRKQEYIKTVLNSVSHPYSHSNVYKTIIDVSRRIKDHSPPSPRSVMRWIKLYLDNDKDLYVLNKIKPGNKFLRFNIEIEQIITLAIKECYLEPKERRSSIDVVSFIKAKMLEQDINVNQCPSLRTIQRRIKQLDPYLVLRAKKGTRIANTTFKAAGIKKESQFVMAIVEIDTHYLDIFIIDEESKEVMGRPFLTCAIDIFTRCIVGWYLSMLPVNASSTLATIKDMLDRPHQGLPGGIPSLIIPDNGVEFKNNTMSKICCELGITIQPAQNRTPDDKAKIERFFGTITHNLIQKIKGTTFSNPREKADYDPKKNASITLANLRSYLTEWIDEIYHKSIHSSISRAPILAWKDAVKISPPILLSKYQIDVLTRKTFKRNINHGQVKFLYLTYKSHVLATLSAQGILEVFLMVDESNLEYIYFQDPLDSSNYIRADSTDPTYTRGLTLYEHELVLEEKKKISKVDKEKLGEHVTDFARWALHQRIQSDVKLNKKAKQLKIELPNHLKVLLEDPIEFNLDEQKKDCFSTLPLMSSQAKDLVLDSLSDKKDNYSDFLTWEFDNE